MSPPLWLFDTATGRLPMWCLYRALRDAGYPRRTAYRWARQRTRSET